MHHRVYDIIGAIDAGECDAVVRITYPSEVDAFKARILTIATNLDASVKGCESLPDNERDAWKLFYDQFAVFAKRPTSLFASYGEWVTTCGYSRYLDAWLEKLRKYGCKIVGEENVSSGNAGTYLKWIVAGVGVVGLTALALGFGPEIKAALRSRRG